MWFPFVWSRFIWSLAVSLRAGALKHTMISGVRFPNCCGAMTGLAIAVIRNMTGTCRPGKRRSGMIPNNRTVRNASKAGLPTVVPRRYTCFARSPQPGARQPETLQEMGHGWFRCGHAAAIA
jgi:hypothetical protein